MENLFNLMKFKTILEEKETLLSEIEIEEFFDEISFKLKEETNIFFEFAENYVWERITNMLVHIPADTILELKTARILELIKCDISKFEILCHHFANNLVETNEYYFVNDNNFGYYYLAAQDNQKNSNFSNENKDDSIKRQEHLVHSFVERDDYDKDSYSTLTEF